MWPGPTVEQVAGFGDKLPEAVAFAAYEFNVGPLVDNPRRVGERLQPPLDDYYSAR